MAVLYTFGDITDASLVLAALAQHSQANKHLSPVVAMTIARTIVQDHVETFYRDMVENPLRGHYNLYVLANGERNDIPDDTMPDRARRDEWDAGIDDVVEKVFAPYERCVSADWFGRNVIDTRLHERPAAGPDAIHRLADSFAREAWQNLIHVLQDGEDGKEVVELSTAKILSAVGVLRSDIEALLAEQPDIQPEKEIMKPMPDVSTTLREFIELTGMSQPEVVALLENVLDSDEGLSMSGITQLGGDKEDAAALQKFVREQFEADASDLYNIIVNGATIYTPPDEEEELAALMGGAPEVVMEPPGAPKVTNGAGPEPKTRKRTPKGELVGAIPTKAWELIRMHVKTRDEDIGSMLGVSRQTFINYSKGKPQLMPSQEQRKALLDLLYKHRSGIDDAMKLISETKSTP